MAERKTLRQFSAAVMRGEEPPPHIDSEEARAALERARATLREAAATMRRLEGRRHG